MSPKRLKRKNLKNKLFSKYRLVILNEDTFEELFSVRLNLINFFIVGTLDIIFLILITTYIIAFTPLREYIPGYSSTQLKREATELALKSDSLTLALQKNEAYIESIRKVLTGQLDYAKFNKDSILNASDQPLPKVELSASKEEIELRKEVKEEEKAALPKKK
jgi:hypothetical protein